MKLPKKLRPFLPYVDRPEPSVRNGEAGHALSKPNEDWINLDVIRSWLGVCERKHGGRCQSADIASFPTRFPDWLIDVEDLCLVCGERNMRYFALSYVWGRSESA